MRVLLVNPGNPQTFWSFERVLRMTGKKAVLPPLGLITVAALLPKEWRLTLVDQVFQEISDDLWNEADLVMITGMSVQHATMLETIREAKRRGKKVVVGGSLVFHFPEQALNAGADIVVRGEAEVVMPRLLECLRGQESGIVISADGPADMEKTPPARYDLLDINAYVDMAIQFSRGCPFHCEFCDITLMFGRTVRTKTPKQILEELTMLYNLGWRRLVFFVDDNFIGNVAMTKRLLPELTSWNESRGRPFDFNTQASVNLGADDELLEAMTRAGFIRVFLGIETTDKESLKGAKKYQNASADLYTLCDKITHAGLQIIAGCIIGFDNEQPGAGRRLIEFADRTRIPEIFTTLLQAAPGTDLAKRMEKEHRLLDIDFEHISNQTGIMNFVPTRSVAEIVEEFIEIYATLYAPESYLKRVYDHFARMAPVKFTRAFKPPYLSEVKAVLITIWRQGFLYPSRQIFWKYLFKALWNYPKRADRFLTACVVAEHYYDFSRNICGILRSQVERLEHAVEDRSVQMGNKPDAPAGR
jgi:radical SAM superfamily enzyme YgiQ (UPF0313 family)